MILLNTPQTDFIDGPLAACKTKLEKIKFLETITGSLGTPSKIPGYSYGLPAGKYCPTGSKLMHVENSTCSKCYALKGHYTFGTAGKAQMKRLKSIESPLWVWAMVRHIQVKTNHGKLGKYFRWHDSGEIQNIEHLKKIVSVARFLGYMRFWLPTREYRPVRAYLDLYGDFPDNLRVRVSAHMIDGPVPTWAKHTSSVTRGQQTCPAPTQGNKCGDCRMCWDDVKHVTYKLH